MNILDSSVWLEYIADTKHAKSFVALIEQPESLLVPAVTLYEVCRKLTKEVGKEIAWQTVAHMRRGTVVDLDAELAMVAVSVSLQHDLPMADSIIYATALSCDATLWTMDSDFRNLDHVRYFSKNAR